MIVALEQDENGDLILPLSDELCAEAGWKIGDTIEWIDNGDGSWTMRKKEMEKELVLVECVSTFRMRYVIEVPAGKKEWALDTVTLNEAEEFSQEHLGEQIVSHRVIDETEYLRVFDEDNGYLKSWDNDKKFRMITRLDEDAVAHSEYWYDTERNK
jgi:hypothetical protein